MTRFSRTPLTSTDDSKIVEIAMRIGQAFEISKLKIDRVHWTNWVRLGRSGTTIPSDWCFFYRRHRMEMPERMIGKMTVEEWTPIIASSLLFNKKLRAYRRWWIYVGVPSFLILVASIVAEAVLAQPWILLPFIIAIPLMAVVGNRRYRPYAKSARLEADTQASALTGKDSFLDVLRKIDLMVSADFDRLKAEQKSRSALALPTITERIENLQSGSPSPSQLKIR